MLKSPVKQRIVGHYFNINPNPLVKLSNFPGSNPVSDGTMDYHSSDDFNDSFGATLKPLNSPRRGDKRHATAHDISTIHSSPVIGKSPASPTILQQLSPFKAPPDIRPNNNANSPIVIESSPPRSYHELPSILRSDQFSSFSEKDIVAEKENLPDEQPTKMLEHALKSPIKVLQHHDEVPQPRCLKQVEEDGYCKRENVKSPPSVSNVTRSIKLQDKLQNTLQDTLRPTTKATTYPPANVLDSLKSFKKRPTSPPSRSTKFQKRSFSTSNDDYSIYLATQKPEIAKSDLANEKFKPLPKSVKALILSSEQEYVLKMVMEGTSMFYTGSAGTGKSVLLRAIIKNLKNKFDKGKVAVTASTGLAACNIGGITLHNFAGVGLAQGTLKSLMKKVKTNKKALNRWKEIKVLVIDEISMIDGKFFNLLNSMAQEIRKNNLPFGGIQLVICGDFFQLPPVSKPIGIDGKPLDKPEEAMFAFESDSWKTCIEKTIILKEVFRQKGDQKFIDMLNDMRTGKVNDTTDQEFRKLSRPLAKVDGIEPAELFCTRWEVDKANKIRIARLPGESKVYNAEDSGSLPPDRREVILNNFLAPKNLFIKKNAQVMCIKNFDETLVNGSLGQVIDFMNRETYMHYKTMKDNPDLTTEEVTEKISKMKKEKVEDLKLANDNNEDLTDSIFDFLNHIPIDSTTDDFDSFESSNTDSSKLNNYTPYEENIKRKRELLESLHKSTNVENNKYPLVRFLLPDGINTREVLVEPELWTIEDENETVLAKRVQLPIILAWSLSIHKSQGQTLPKVKVDLRKVFENGQAYVALSRAVSRQGLQVLNFDRFKVRTHPKVAKFYKSLSSTDDLKKSTRFGQNQLNFKPLQRPASSV